MHRARRQSHILFTFYDDLFEFAVIDIYFRTISKIFALWPTPVRGLEMVMPRQVKVAFAATGTVTIRVRYSELGPVCVYNHY